jgi:hypothetical protein
MDMAAVILTKFRGLFRKTVALAKADDGDISRYAVFLEPIENDVDAVVEEGNSHRREVIYCEEH